MSINVLLVDDEPMVVKALARLFASLDCEISSTSSPIDALQLCSENQFDLVIADQRMPLLTGSQLLGQIREKYPSTQSILISAYSDFNDVVEGFNSGVLDQFVPKPWDDDELIALVKAAINSNNKSSQNKTPAASAAMESLEEAEDLTNFNGLLSASTAMLTTFKKLEKAAAANMPVFIAGETGTGKEMSAKAIHIGSHRADEPFISFNCANFTETLMESQIFGHKKGSFTGAVSDQAGLLAEVGSGTLFLDEVTSMDIGLQAKLLRVLQEREFSMVGSYELLPFKGQVVSASSESLKQAVDSGTFREDLRYRLEVIAVTLPPLRERREDIIPLFKRFVRQNSEGRSFTYEETVLEKLSIYPWPGNIRQLQNSAMYATAMAESEQIGITSLPRDLREFDSPTSSKTKTQAESSNQGKAVDIDKETLSEELSACRGNKSQAAKNLGISRMTLWRLLQKFELE